MAESHSAQGRPTQNSNHLLHQVSLTTPFKTEIFSTLTLSLFSSLQVLDWFIFYLPLQMKAPFGQEFRVDSEQCFPYSRYSIILFIEPSWYSFLRKDLKLIAQTIVFKDKRSLASSLHLFGLNTWFKKETNHTYVCLDPELRLDTKHRQYEHNSEDEPGAWVKSVGNEYLKSPSGSQSDFVSTHFRAFGNIWRYFLLSQLRGAPGIW